MQFIGRRLLEILAGTPLIGLGLALVAGGFQAAFAVFAISVICTAGLGLFFWMFISWFTGWLMATVVRLTQGKPILPGMAPLGHKQQGERGGDSPSTAALSRDDAAVVRYIQSAREYGFDWANIESRLKQNGWNDHAIARGRQLVGG